MHKKSEAEITQSRAFGVTFKITSTVVANVPHISFKVNDI